MKLSNTLAAVLVLVSVSFASAQGKLKLPVTASSKTLDYSPLWVAWKQGFLDKQGLDVQVVLVSGADKSVMALVGGSTYAAAVALLTLGLPQFSAALEDIKVHTSGSTSADVLAYKTAQVIN